MSSYSSNNSSLEYARLTPIERSNPLADTIVQRIKELILSNVLQSGDQLAEAALAEQFGVSRIPVREAILTLERFGLVHKEPYQPAVVSSLTDEDLDELHHVRLLIEPWAASRLAIQASSDDLAVLTQILREMEQAAHYDQKSEMIQLDLSLHNAIVTLNHNSLLNEMWSLVSMRLHRFLLLKRRRAYPNLAACVEQHRPLVDAIIARQPEKAEVAVRNHLLEVYRIWQEDPYRLSKTNLKKEP